MQGVCESTENDGDDDQQYSAAAVSTSGATAFAVKNSSVFEDVEVRATTQLQPRDQPLA